MGLNVQLSLDNPAVKAYVFYGSVLVLKCILMSFWTARHRIGKKVFPSPEDYGPKKDGKPNTIRTHPDVERVRRAHHNDLENIPVFLILGFLSLLANPSFNVIWVFRVFTACRVVHTLAYLNEITPIRALSFAIGAVCSIILAGGIIARVLPLSPF